MSLSVFLINFSVSSITHITLLSNLKLDIFAPHGGDIFHHCFYKFNKIPPARFEYGSWWRASMQRKGVKAAKLIMFDYTNDWNESFFIKLNINKNREYLNLPYIFPDQYNSANYQKSSEYEKAKLVREQYKNIFFHHARHCWVTDLHYKANDKLIIAYANFIKKNSNSSSLLIMFEYGWDYKASQNLVIELGIEENVLWLPLMKAKP